MSTKILCRKPGYDIYPGYIDCWYTSTKSIIVAEVFNPVTLMVNKKKYFLKEGEVILISTKHAYIKFLNEGSLPCRLRGLILRSEKARNLEEFCERHLSLALSECVSNLLQSAISEELMDSSPSLSKLVTPFFKEKEEKTSEPSMKQFNSLDTRLIKMNRYIRKNYTNPNLSLSSLGDLLKLNPIYISNCYSRVFKIPPIYHINKLRIQNAVELLESKELKISEVARQVGYSTTAQFSSMFKRYCNMSPSEYRSKI